MSLPDAFSLPVRSGVADFEEDEAFPEVVFVVVVVVLVDAAEEWVFDPEVFALLFGEVLSFEESWESRRLGRSSWTQGPIPHPYLRVLTRNTMHS